MKYWNKVGRYLEEKVLKPEAGMCLKYLRKYREANVG